MLSPLAANLIRNVRGFCGELAALGISTGPVLAVARFLLLLLLTVSPHVGR
jgi:hypothetical protein